MQKLLSESPVVEYCGEEVQYSGRKPWLVRKVAELHGFDWPSFPCKRDGYEFASKEVDRRFLREDRYGDAEDGYKKVKVYSVRYQEFRAFPEHIEIWEGAEEVVEITPSNASEPSEVGYGAEYGY